MNLQQRKVKMANPHRLDYGEEFVEQLRKKRLQKATYVFVNGQSSGDEEEEEELCFEDEDDEIVSNRELADDVILKTENVFMEASYAADPPRRPPSVHSSRRPPSVAHSHRADAAFGFTARDLYFFGVLSELTDKFTPEMTARLVAKKPPPEAFRSLAPIERVAYLLYFSLYGRYLPVDQFHKVFNREFYKYTSAGVSDRVAFIKICRMTLEEYKQKAREQTKRAYKLSQKHLFSDGRATPDSRMSDRPSMESGEDMNSIDSLAKELMFYRSPHAPVRFGRGGRVVYVDPTRAMSTVCVEDLKRFFKDAEGRRYVEMLEGFKGPLLVGHTPPQTPLLFIQCQISRLLQSDVYRANPSSGDANDCLLIWSLLEMLIRQHGKVTGPDLARLLCANQPNHLASLRKTFLKNDGTASRPVSRHSSTDAEVTNGAASAMDRVSQFLLGGHIDEAIDSAISDGLLSDALLLANRLFRDDRNRLDAVEARVMAHRSPQHPVTTLLSVAADQPVPLLTNPTSYETNGWRSHIAIVLANLHSATAMNAVYQLGLALAQKEFNSAADFCFLAVNLLYGYDCFQLQQTEKDGHQRISIGLISATLPDDEANHSFLTRFGWSVLDYQATELFDFALQLGNPSSATLLSNSNRYATARLQYVQLLDELGGFKSAVELYRPETCDQSKTPSPPLKFSSASNPQFVLPKSQLHGPTTSAIHTFQPVRSHPKNVPLDHSSAVRTSITDDARFSSAEEHYEVPLRRSRSPSPSPAATLTNSPPNVSSIHTFMANPRTSESNEDGDLAEKVNVQNSFQPQPQNNAQLQPPSFPLPLPPFFTVTTSQNIVNVVQQPQHEMNGFNVDAQPTPSLGLPSVSSTADRLPPTGAILEGPKIVAASLPSSAGQKQKETTKKATSNTEEKSEAAGGGGKGFLRGFLSKIKVPIAESNEMKLPEDTQPKIVWDSNLGRYVDQDQTQQQPAEELAPPPTIPSYQPQWQHIAPPGQQQPPSQPGQQPPAQSSAASSRGAFQGKSRYANAWTS